MNKIVSIYTKAIKENLRPLYPNWEPTTPVRLGDYGYLEDDFFTQLGNIEDLGISFSTRNNNSNTRKAFYSKEGVSFSFTPKTITDIDTFHTNASLEIKFDKEDAVFFNATGCNHQIISNKSKVGEEILLLLRQKKWKKGFVVITELVKSNSTLIVISGGKESDITFEANANITNIDLNQIDLKLSISKQSNIGYCVDAQKDLIPLIGLSKLKSNFFEIEFKSQNMLPDIPAFADEDDELIFKDLD